MYNKYTIELNEKEKDVRATLYIGKDALGSVWVPNNKLKTKKDFVELFNSIGMLIYGQETKAKKKEESDSKILTLLEAKSRAEQAEIQKEE